MKIRGSLTAREFAEVRRMSRTWKDRLTWFFRPGAAGLLLLFVVMTLESLAHDPGDWWKMGLMWLFIIGIATWATVNRRREKRKALADWNAATPEFIVLSAAGVAGERAGRTGESLPWNGYKSWREGKFVFLLRSVKSNRAQALPKSDLSDQQIQEVRGMLELFLRSTR